MHIQLVINYCAFFSQLLFVFSGSGGYDPAVLSAVNALQLAKKKKKVTFPPPYLSFQWLRIL